MPKGQPTHEHDGMERHNINKKHLVTDISKEKINNFSGVQEKPLENEISELFSDILKTNETNNVVQETVIITKINPAAKIEENKLGLDLFLLSDIELHNGLTTIAKTGIIIDIPDGYFGMISLDDEIASNGAIMLGSPKYIYGKQEVEFYVTAMIGNFFEFRRGRKIAQIVFYKKENVNYEYAS